MSGLRKFQQQNRQHDRSRTDSGAAEERAASLTDYLRIVLAYADAALSSGADPDSVFLNVWGQLENWRIGLIDGADPEPERRHRVARVEQRDLSTRRALERLETLLAPEPPDLDQIEEARITIEALSRVFAEG